MTKTFLSLRPKNDVRDVRAFSWFLADFESLLIRWLKFRLPSIWTPKSLTDVFDLIFWFSILTSVLLLWEPRFSRKSYLKLVRNYIHFVLWSQLVAASHADSKFEVILRVYLQNWLKYYHLQSYKQRLLE